MPGQIMDKAVGVRDGQGGGEYEVLVRMRAHVLLETWILGSAMGALDKMEVCVEDWDRL